MKTTIWQLIGATVMIPATVTAETELSYIAKPNYDTSNEFCFPKKTEGIDWFWTEEEAEKESKFRKYKKFRMHELQQELEKQKTEPQV